MDVSKKECWEKFPDTLLTRFLTRVKRLIYKLLYRKVSGCREISKKHFVESRCRMSGCMLLQKE